MLYESFFDPRNAFWWSPRLPSLTYGLKVEIWKIIIFIIFCGLYVRILAVDEMVFYASPGALLLHVFIKMLEVSGKTSKGPDGWPKIWELWKTDPRNLQNVIFHENWAYEICSTSHFLISGLLFDDPWGSPASDMDSKLKSEKSSFSSFFVTSKFEFELWAKPSFLLPPRLFFCMRSLKYSNCPRKPVRAQGGAQKNANFEKLTPKITKMSFFMKFKTSPHLPPYYSTEPMKYALRVILSMFFEFLEVPCAPGCA